MSMRFVRLSCAAVAMLALVCLATPVQAAGFGSLEAGPSEQSSWSPVDLVSGWVTSVWSVAKTTFGGPLGGDGTVSGDADGPAGTDGSIGDTGTDRSASLDPNGAV